MAEKKIEVVRMRVGDIQVGFGNPRRIKKNKRDDLQKSLDTFGDFGLILIDEGNNVIAGNQRVSILREESPDTEVLCKRLIGYTKSELKAINIKANTHAGEWDLDMLADWTADINIDLGFQDETAAKDLQERKIKEMELIHYEKYDYVMLVCKNTFDYEELISRLGIEGARVRTTNKRTIKARAVWFDKVRDKLFGKEKA